MNSREKFIGYRLKHPESNKHYVGITSQKCETRLRQHLYSSEKNKKSSWIKSHKDQKDLFYMDPFFECSSFEKAKKLEIYWIAKDRKVYGYENIMNGTDGGEGTLGLVHTEESKKKMSLSLKGKTSPRKGVSLSPETKLKLSKAKSGTNHPNFGKHHSVETKIKMSNSAKGRVPWIQGKHHSLETREKISKSNKGIKKSLEHKRNLSLSKKEKPSSRKGMKSSKETRLKISKSKAVLSKEQVLKIFEMLKQGKSYPEISKIFNVTPSTICNLKNGKTKMYKIYRRDLG